MACDGRAYQVSELDDRPQFAEFASQIGMGGSDGFDIDCLPGLLVRGQPIKELSQAEIAIVRRGHHDSESGSSVAESGRSASAAA